jgi:transposase InsO family protein
LNREFDVKETGKVWVSDITYIRTYNGWLYLTVILDLADRKAIGWALSNNMRAENTVCRAWKMAIKNRPITKKLIFHSDRGVQYACDEFTKLLQANTLVKQSMSRKGNCWDNAVAESFFKSLKVECVYQHVLRDREYAASVVFEYIETWYNRLRRHSYLNNQTIEEYEQNIINQKLVA